MYTLNVEKVVEQAKLTANGRLTVVGKKSLPATKKLLTCLNENGSIEYDHHDTLDDIISTESRVAASGNTFLCLNDPDWAKLLEIRKHYNITDDMMQKLRLISYTVMTWLLTNPENTCGWNFQAIFSLQMAGTTVAVIETVHQDKSAQQIIEEVGGSVVELSNNPDVLLLLPNFKPSIELLDKMHKIDATSIVGYDYFKSITHPAINLIESDHQQPLHPKKKTAMDDHQAKLRGDGVLALFTFYYACHDELILSLVGTGAGRAMKPVSTAIVIYEPGFSIERMHISQIKHYRSICLLPSFITDCVAASQIVNPSKYVVDLPSPSPFYHWTTLSRFCFYLMCEDSLELGRRIQITGGKISSELDTADFIITDATPPLTHKDSVMKKIDKVFTKYMLKEYLSRGTIKEGGKKYWHKPTITMKEKQLSFIVFLDNCHERQYVTELIIDIKGRCLNSITSWETSDVEIEGTIIIWDCKSSSLPLPIRWPGIQIITPQQLIDAVSTNEQWSECRDLKMIELMLQLSSEKVLRPQGGYISYKDIPEPNRKHFITPIKNYLICSNCIPVDPVEMIKYLMPQKIPPRTTSYSNFADLQMYSSECLLAGQLPPHTNYTSFAEKMQDMLRELNLWTITVKSESKTSLIIYGVLNRMDDGIIVNRVVTVYSKYFLIHADALGLCPHLPMSIITNVQLSCQANECELCCFFEEEANQKLEYCQVTKSVGIDFPIQQFSLNVVHAKNTESYASVQLFHPHLNIIIPRCKSLEEIQEKIGQKMTEKTIYDLPNLVVYCCQECSLSFVPSHAVFISAHSLMNSFKPCPTSCQNDKCNKNIEKNGACCIAIFKN